MQNLQVLYEDFPFLEEALYNAFVIYNEVEEDRKKKFM